MNIFSFIWNDVLIEPILNFVLFLYNVLPTHDLGVVIIVITVIIRLAVLPLSLKAARAQKKIKDVTPQLNELKEKHKGDQAALAKAQMEFYKQNRISPIGSCLPILIQFPILIALYHILGELLTSVDPAQVYSFIHLPEKINTMFLGALDLAVPNKYVLPIIAGALQYVLSFMTMPALDKTKKQSPEMMASRNAMFMMPLITVFLGMSVPAGLTLYWCASTLFSVAQQFIVNKEKGKGIKIRIKKDSEEHNVYILEEGKGNKEEQS